MTADQLIAELQKHASDVDATFLPRFFKAGPGEYAEGDQFIGVRVPMTRKVCKEFRDLPLAEIQKLLDSPIHEHRLAALILLSDRYPKAKPGDQQAIFDLYLKNARKGRINNWDLVDTSAEYVIGPHLGDDRELLFELASSDDLWLKRIGMLSSFHYIKHGDASTTLELAEILLHDKHDLIQKAVGWMLREVGKRVDRSILLGFLDKHAHEMPRTMLRYAIEHLPAEQRQHYLQLRNR